jgi:hypothetical protein
VVHGKRRQKGAQGKNAKNHGITTTQRDPSQFEYVLSSSAPAILSRGRSKKEPSESAAVSNLIAMSHTNAINLDSEEVVKANNDKDNEFIDINNLIDPELRALSTILLAIQRLECVADAYVPGTLLPRLY